MSYLNNPAYWRDRAEKTRAIAEQCWKDGEKERMLRVADEYERLADLAAERLRSDTAFVAGKHAVSKTSQPTPQPSPPLSQT